MIHTRNTRGLTFLEIMIVVVIVGVLMALALPNMSGPRESMALRGASRDIAAGGKLARQIAITQGSQTMLVLRPEDKKWQIIFDINREDTKGKAWAWRESRNISSDERERELPNRVEYAAFSALDEKLDARQEQRIYFYPNGSSSGLAIQLRNGRGHTAVVDFDMPTGQPRVYDGEPKTQAQKLREAGLNPADYGLDDGAALAASGSDSSGRFYTSAGMTEEERVDYYQDAVQRMIQRTRAQDAVAREGPGAYYSEAARWGSR